MMPANVGQDSASANTVALKAFRIVLFLIGCMESVVRINRHARVGYDGFLVLTEIQ
jgi:hypothetical protein